jgi:hypothetical protein
MDYLERYKSGDCEAVWTDLQNLGAAVRDEPHYSQALEVAAETMRRVRRNCERLIDRLRAMDYKFGTYPDGSTGYYTSGPLLRLDEASRDDIAALEEAVGPLPLSLVAFWEQVGSVDFVGMLRSWPTGLDALVIEGPEAAISVLDDRDQMIEDIGHFEASLAPDALHKDNVSGGAPYAVELPNPGADFLFLNERHNLTFVPYLRLAILRFGGFPGLDGGTAEFDSLPTLLDGLEPF